MKKVVNGKVYNTETSELVASSGFVRCYSMQDNHERDVYKTKKGNFFEVYSRYVWHGNSAGYQTDIFPICEDRAKELFESYDGDPEKYAEVFGEVEEA